MRPDSDITWNGDLLSIKLYRIGMVPKWSVGIDFEKAAPHLLIDYAPGLDLCFQKLMIGRVDLVPTSIREANAVFKQLGLSARERPVAIEPVLATHYNYFGFSKLNRNKLKAFKTEFETILQQMYRAGEIEKIRKDIRLR